MNIRCYVERINDTVTFIKVSDISVQYSITVPAYGLMTNGKGMVVDNILNKSKFYVLLLFHLSREGSSTCYDSGSVPTKNIHKF